MKDEGGRMKGEVESTTKAICPVSSFILHPSIFVMNELGKRYGNVTERVVQAAAVPSQPGRVVRFAQIRKFAC
jgi:hypothetical protein